jgi:hypothetical protein
VWLVIAFPLLSVIAGIAIVVIAVRSDDGLVVDDYYKRGLEINRELARDRAARTRGLVADLQWSPDTKQFRIVLSANSGESPPAELNVSFLHRTRAGFDHEVSAVRSARETAVAPFVYEGAAPDLASGDWDVLISADDWRLLVPLNAP